MKPYPFASLNHFTCPCGILRPRFTGGLQAPVCSRRVGGVCPPTLEGKEKRRADSGRAAYQSVLADSRTPRGRPERPAECHTVGIKSIENPRFGPRSTRSGWQARDNDHRKLARGNRKLARFKLCATRPRKPYPFRRSAKSPKSLSALVFRFITAAGFATIALRLSPSGRLRSGDVL